MKSDNVDYKKLYYLLMNAVEDTINDLIEVQRRCEELYLLAGDEKEQRIEK